MRTTIPTLFAAATLTMSAQAFTIDFNSLVVPEGTTVNGVTPLVINVVGYGDVRFEVGPASGDVLVVDDTHKNDSGTFTYSLELDAGETVLVTFLGSQAINVDFDIIGIDNGESANLSQFSASEFQLDAIGGDGVGIAAVSWDTVPEPGSSLLILIGAGSMILRRRRRK